MKDKILRPIIAFFSNRVFMMFVIICALFYMLSTELFHLQIVEGEKHLATLSTRVAEDVEISAQRGSIYDRYGRPLAVNQFAYSVFLDPSVIMTEAERNQMLYDFVRLLEKNGEDYIDDLPLSPTEPFEFTFYDDETGSKRVRWILQMALTKDETEAARLTASEVFSMLVDRYGLDESHPDISLVHTRQLISLRTKMWLVSWTKFNSLEIASSVGMDTVTRIEEGIEKFKSLGVEKKASRYYPEGEYLAHIVGFVGRINTDEYERYGKQNNYSLNDIVGKSGIEQAFENNLRGTNGQLTVIVNNVGRKIAEIDGSRIEPIQGDKIFLTIDAEFQKECYNLAIEMLKEVLIGRLTSYDPKVWSLSATDVLSSLVAANNISPRDVFESEPGSYSYIIKQYVLSMEPEANVDTNADRLAVNKIIAEGIKEGHISLINILIVLIEQDIITGDEYYIERIRNGWISPTQVLVEKITADEITPAMTNIDPCTVSLVVEDIRTGDVLAAVSYPSFDTNEYMNNINTVFPKLNNDPTSPQLNRAFVEQRAPGSTFKMASAIAGLETGTITGGTYILDQVKFTAAGKPEPSCWNSAGHGSVNVAEALACSCNYFFFETLYRMGNTKSNNKMTAIAQLNKYMSLLGFDEPSGVEIGEAGKARGKSPINMSSPELKEYKLTGNLTESPEWMDGDASRTAIGQGLNNYTPAVMARYISIIATRGDKYDFHLLKRIVTNNEVLEYLPRQSSVNNEISDHTWDVIHAGMRQTLTGTSGTARAIFEGFPIAVAGKTGTAQEISNRPEHTSFGGFAPYNEPEIAIYVMIPFSDTKATSSPATVLARRVLESYFKLDSEIETAIPLNALTE